MTSVEKNLWYIGKEEKIILDESFPRTRASEARLNKLSGKPNSGGHTWEGGGGCTPYNGLYGEAPPEKGTFFRLQVYEIVGKSVMRVFERAQMANR